MGNFIPRFWDARLQALTVCATISKPTSSQFNDAPLRIQSKCTINDADPGWIRILLTNDPDDVAAHFHVEIGREPHYSEHRGLETRDWAFAESLFARFLNKKCKAFFEATFNVPFDDFPRRGVVRMLLDLNADVGGSEISLFGAKFAIAEDYYLDFNWEVDWEGDSIKTEISGYGEELTINGEYLQRGVDLMKSGLEKFVLESPPEKKRNEHRTRKAKNKATEA